MLEAGGLSKHFNGVNAVDDVSFRFDKGRITSLIGPNGAGKTTLFNIISGYIEPDKGFASFEGKKLNGSAPHARASRGLGRTFQNLRIIGRISVLDNVMLAFGNHSASGFIKVLARFFSRNVEEMNRSKAFEHLEFVGLAEKAHELSTKRCGSAIGFTS